MAGVSVCGPFCSAIVDALCLNLLPNTISRAESVAVVNILQIFHWDAEIEEGASQV